ncbi:MAG: lytic transglycosylase domain-containing protein [Proteobacteria bacterium]|nr:lytic transglycosylase domain-containing protein [Pseudomonadota bacterium]
MLKICLSIFLFSLISLQTTEVRAESLYVVKGNRGVITYTTRRPQNSENYSVFVPKNYSFSKFYTITGSSKWFFKTVKSSYDGTIFSLAGLYQLDPALVKAVVHVESFFNPRARSPKGAMGLMQLMPGTAQRFGVDKPYIPEDNIRGGVTYLKMLYDRYSGNERLVLAAYNAGEGNVDKIMEVPPFKETQVYVKRVLKMKELYRCELDGRQNC